MIFYLKSGLYSFLCFCLFSFQAHAQQTSYTEALHLKSQGKYQQSENAFLQLTQNNPQKSEHWFQLGLTQRYQNKIDAALNSQSQALQLAPDNMDIVLEMARLHHSKGNSEKAIQLLDQILGQSPKNIEAQELVKTYKQDQLNQHTTQQSFSRPYRWQIDTLYQYSKLSKISQPNWQYQLLRTGYWLNNATEIHAQFENTQRFNRNNQLFTLGTNYIFKRFNSIGFSLGHSQNSTFIPQWRIKSNLDLLVFDHKKNHSDIFITLNAQHDRYDMLDLYILKPGLRYQIFNTLYFHPQTIWVIDENRKNLFGGAGRLDWTSKDEETRLFLGSSYAPETENAVVIYTFAIYAGVSRNISPNFHLSASYAHENRESSFIRDIFTLSAKVMF